MTGFAFTILGAAIVVALSVLKVRFASFVAQTPKDYSSQECRFDIRQHLNGPIVCEGVIYGPLGRVSSRFVGEFNCQWDNDIGTMKERFEYDDGTVQNREWRLQVGDDDRIKATASDVVGEGHGTHAGPSVQLMYRLRLPDSAGGHILDVVDWMYLAPNGNIVNRSQFRKFGIQVAELVATMRPTTVVLKESK